jgi:hypothetical protein
MRVKEKKTVRFAQLVEEFGRPEQVTLWTAPEENRDFMKAVRENRVVTVIHQNIGSKADYGLVGFFKKALAAFVVFPKRLPYPAETKIIGIKYQEIAESKSAGPLFRPSCKTSPGISMREEPSWQPARETKIGQKTARPKAPKAEAPVKVEPKNHQFRANVELVASETVPVEVTARTAAEAKELLQEKAAQLTPDANARIRRKIGKPAKVS